MTKPWLQAVLKVVVMAATVCSGIIVTKDGMPFGEKRNERERDHRQDRQDLDRAA